MSSYDKSDQVGYDETDKELNAELEEMLAQMPPQMRGRMQHRLHDGILQRMKEETARKCFPLIKKFEECVNSVKPYDMDRCYPHRDALNDCAQEINREEVYQQYRIMYLRGELLKYHEQRMIGKMEAFKAAVPDALPAWKADYAPKYANMRKDIAFSTASSKHPTTDAEGKK